MNRLFISGPVLLCLSIGGACTREAPPDGAPPEVRTAASLPTASLPEVDLSTPDRAVKSYWALQDTKAAFEREQALWLRETEPNRRIEQAWRHVLAGDYLAYEDKRREPAHFTFQRGIVNVDQQTESRAIVEARIRNTTPIPPGAEPGQFDAEMRRNGFRYRYILEKSADGWKVVQAQEYLGIERQWRNQFDPTPYVPSFVVP